MPESEISPLEFIPWSWTLNATTTSEGTCPSLNRVLGTYAIAATIISVVCLIAGHRAVVVFFTCGHCGREGSKAWRFTWVFPLALSALAAAINAAIIKRHPNRVTDYPMYALFLLQLTLPRMSFLCLLITFWVQWLMDWDPLIGDLAHGSAAAGALIAELVLQLPIMYYLGRILYFVAHHGYWVWSSKFHHAPKAAKMMYIAAMYHFTSSCVAIAIFIVFSIVLCVSHTPERLWVSWVIFLCVVLGALTFCADWVFWAGFLELAGDTYCVPQLELQAGIRVGFSAIGAMLGGGAW